MQPAEPNPYAHRTRAAALRARISTKVAPPSRGPGERDDGPLGDVFDDLDWLLDAVAVVVAGESTRMSQADFAVLTEPADVEPTRGFRRLPRRIPSRCPEPARRAGTWSRDVLRQGVVPAVVDPNPMTGSSDESGCSDE
jgi:hypothetical protein